MEGKGEQEPGTRQGSQTVPFQAQYRGPLGTNKFFSHSLHEHWLSLSWMSGTLLGTVGGGGVQMCKKCFLPWGQETRKQIILSP